MFPGRVRKGCHKEKAQGLVEFAIILPVMLITLFVIIELARIFHAWMAVENGARMGLRYAVTREINEGNCDGGGEDGKCYQPMDEQKARILSIHDAAWAGSSSIHRVKEEEAAEDDPGFFNITVCRPENLVEPASGSDTYHCDPEDPGEPGELVAIIVEFNHPLILPIVDFVGPHIRLFARRDGRVEDWRISKPAGVPPDIELPIPPEPSPVILCQDWNDLHAHKPWYGENHLGIIIHEAHGWPKGPAVNQVILRSVTIHQELTNPRLLNLENVEVGHPPKGDTNFSIDEKTPAYYLVVNQEMVYCYPEHCDQSYRGMYVTSYFDGTLDGVYSLEAELFFPEYSQTCHVWGEIDTNAPPPDPGDPGDPVDPTEPPDPIEPPPVKPPPDD
jgi:hypothetical protein